MMIWPQCILCLFYCALSVPDQNIAVFCHSSQIPPFYLSPNVQPLHSPPYRIHPSKTYQNIYTLFRRCKWNTIKQCTQNNGIGKGKSLKAFATDCLVTGAKRKPYSFGETIWIASKIPTKMMTTEPAESKVFPQSLLLINTTPIKMMIANVKPILCIDRSIV